MACISHSPLAKTPGQLTPEVYFAGLCCEQGFSKMKENLPSRYPLEAFPEEKVPAFSHIQKWVRCEFGKEQAFFLPTPKRKHCFFHDVNFPIYFLKEEELKVIILSTFLTPTGLPIKKALIPFLYYNVIANTDKMVL